MSPQEFDLIPSILIATSMLPQWVLIGSSLLPRAPRRQRGGTGQNRGPKEDKQYFEPRFWPACPTGGLGPSQITRCVGGERAGRPRY